MQVINRRELLALLGGGMALSMPERAQLDKLVVEYKEAWNGADFRGDQVIYNRENWDAIDEAFRNIMAFIIGRLR